MPIQQMLLGVGGGAKPGEESSSPITNYTQAGEWHSNTGGDQLAWIQKSGINGGSPYQVFCQYSNGHLWGAVGRWVGSDNTASNASGGYYRWCTCKNPNNGDNDWGQATHTFNQNFNKWNGSESARTRLWFEGQGNKTRVLFTGIVGRGDPLEYDMSDSNTWGTRMQGITDYYKNDQGVTTGDQLGSYSSTTSTPSDDWKTIGRQVSDGEAVGATSNDVFMIVFCVAGKWTNNDWTQMNGLGWKRSGVSGQWPRTGNQSSFPTFWTQNHIDTGGTVSGDGVGVICEDSDNGALRDNYDGKMILMVNIFS
tara:strand:+ start:303 stop:1229 length:927 start_codon:yes stop_codon:yes gene_type:complete